MNAEVKGLIEAIRSKFTSNVYNVRKKTFQPMEKYNEFIEDIYKVIDKVGFNNRAATLAVSHIARGPNEEEIIRALEDFVEVFEQQNS
jgi:hypothetical protein